MKVIGLAVVLALVGAAVSCTAAWWAATQWSSFNDHWLFATCALPGLATVLAAWLAKSDEWPPETETKVGLAIVSGVVGGLSSYVAFALVSVVWNKVDVAGASGFVELLLDPGRIPPLATRATAGPARAFEENALARGALGAFAGAFTPVVFLRKYGRD